MVDTIWWNKVCQSPAECYWFSLCTYICHFPWSGVLDTIWWNKVCQWPAECYWFSLCTYIFTSHGQVYLIQPYDAKWQWPAEGYWFSQCKSVSCTIQSDRQNNCNIMLNYHSYMYNIITFSYFKCSWPFLKLKEIWVDERSMSFILISNRTHLTSFHIRQLSDYNR
jgi:hypothetical protein